MLFLDTRITHYFVFLTADKAKENQKHIPISLQIPMQSYLIRREVEIHS